MRATLYQLIGAMQSTSNTEIKYLIQQVAPTFLNNMDRAHALSEKF